MASKTSEETSPLLSNVQQGQLEPVAKALSPNLHTYGLSKWKRRGACGSILFCVMFERVAFYGFTSNLLLFLNKSPFNWMSYDAANASFLFLCVSYVFSVAGGLIADTLLGRFKTLLLSFVVYMVGSSLLVAIGYASTSEPFATVLCGAKPDVTYNNVSYNSSANIVPLEGSNYCSWLVYLSLVVIAVGAGSVRANLSPFGGDQVRYEGPEVIRMFFHWFYWAINVGSLVALGGITVLQQNINFFLGFLVPAGSLLVATMIFAVGRSWYLSRKPMGSVLTNTFRIFFQAVAKRKTRHHLYRAQESNQLLRTQSMPSFLDMAKVRFGGSFHESMVEDVKSLKLIILVFLGLMPYWVVYFQMQTTFLMQGLHLRFTIHCMDPECENTDSFEIPPAWFSLFDVVIVLILLPILDRFFYPFLDRHGLKLTLLRRMIVGMLFSTLAMVAAGVLEHERLDWLAENPNDFFNQTIGNTVYHAADIWILWQIPQYTLVGFGEVFASVAGLEFAYAMAPRSMQGLIMGVFNLSHGLAALLGSAILSFATLPAIGWFKTADYGNINTGRLDLYFYLLAGIQLLSGIVFAAITLTYEAKESRSQASITTSVNESYDRQP